MVWFLFVLISSYTKVDADEYSKTLDVLEDVCCGYEIEIVDVDKEK